MASIPEPQSVTDYVADGARIAAILLIWGVFAAFFSYGVTELTSSFERVFTQLGELLAI
jgi:succinate-acetate transporter protein